MFVQIAHTGHPHSLARTEPNGLGESQRKSIFPPARPGVGRSQASTRHLSNAAAEKLLIQDQDGSAVYPL